MKKLIKDETSKKFEQIKRSLESAEEYWEHNMRLSEAVQLIENGNILETIPVEKQGDEVVILRFKSMPEFGLAMWNKKPSSTLWKITLRTPPRTTRCFAVICACCPSESYGIENWKNLPTKEQKKLGEEYRQGIEIACQEAGIKILFVRNAGKNSLRYGREIAMRIQEADQFRHLAYLLYGRKKVDEIRKYFGVGTNLGQG